MKELSEKDRLERHHRINGYLAKLTKIDKRSSKLLLELAKIQIWLAENPPGLDPSEKWQKTFSVKQDRANHILQTLKNFQKSISELQAAYYEEASKLGLKDESYISYIK